MLTRAAAISERLSRRLADANECGFDFTAEEIEGILDAVSEVVWGLVPSELLKAGETEPVFSLRAQDETASKTVTFWRLVQHDGSPRAERAREVAAKMRAWPGQKAAD